MKPLLPPDNHHLAAVEGWLGLGNPAEAAQELEQISPAARQHPEVLGASYQVSAATRNWESATVSARAICETIPESPFGWIHLAYALHELKRTREAYEVLIPVLETFPDDYVMRYNLACYSCQLGDLAEARRWLRQAVPLAGPNEIKRMAADDLDLQPLWPELDQLAGTS